MYVLFWSSAPHANCWAARIFKTETNSKSAPKIITFRIQNGCPTKRWEYSLLETHFSGISPLLVTIEDPCLSNLFVFRPKTLTKKELKEMNMHFKYQKMIYFEENSSLSRFTLHENWLGFGKPSQEKKRFFMNKWPRLLLKTWTVFLLYILTHLTFMLRTLRKAPVRAQSLKIT